MSLALGVTAMNLRPKCIVVVSVLVLLQAVPRYVPERDAGGKKIQANVKMDGRGVA